MEGRKLFTHRKNPRSLQGFVSLVVPTNQMEKKNKSYFCTHSQRGEIYFKIAAENQCTWIKDLCLKSGEPELDNARTCSDHLIKCKATVTKLLIAD